MWWIGLMALAGAAEPAGIGQAPVTEVPVADGRTVPVVCSGSGKPTYWLDPGLGSDREVFSLLVPELEQHGTVCVYDRAGLGDAAPAKGQRTVVNWSDELHRAMRGVGVRKAVLVTHGYGAIAARAHVHQYPGDVGAVVLLNPSHPQLEQRMLQHLGVARKGEPESLTELRAFLQGFPKDPSLNVEGMDLATSSKLIASAKDFGKRPLLVVYGEDAPLPDGLPAPVEQALTDELDTLRQEVLDWARVSTQVELHAGGIPQLQAPRETAAAITTFVDEKM